MSFWKKIGAVLSKYGLIILGVILSVLAAIFLGGKKDDSKIDQKIKDNNDKIKDLENKIKQYNDNKNNAKDDVKDLEEKLKKIREEKNNINVDDEEDPVDFLRNFAKTGSDPNK